MAIDVGSRKAFEEMNKAIDFHKMHPIVDRVFEFDKLGDALKYLEEARHFGKSACEVNPRSLNHTFLRLY